MRVKTRLRTLTQKKKKKHFNLQPEVVQATSASVSAAVDEKRKSKTVDPAKKKILRGKSTTKKPEKVELEIPVQKSEPEPKPEPEPVIEAATTQPEPEVPEEVSAPEMAAPASEPQPETETAEAVSDEVFVQEIKPEYESAPSVEQFDQVPPPEVPHTSLSAVAEREQLEEPQLARRHRPEVDTTETGNDEFRRPNRCQCYITSFSSSLTLRTYELTDIFSQV
jgi:hypothetical protein